MAFAATRIIWLVAQASFNTNNSNGIVVFSNVKEAYSDNNDCEPLLARCITKRYDANYGRSLRDLSYICFCVFNVTGCGDVFLVDDQQNNCSSFCSFYGKEAA